MWVKICGIRDVPTALRMAELGADAIGLSFYPASPRYVSRRIAAEIVRQLPPSVLPVGVFVNAPAEEIRETCEETGLSTIQLHGDESPEDLLDHPTLNLIRVLRVRGDCESPIQRELAAYRSLGIHPWRWLIDAHVPGTYGGTGTTVEWETLAPSRRGDDWPSIILAGGLTPENVSQAILAVRPWGVDVASGVESQPGVKDDDRAAAFIQTVRAAS